MKLSISILALTLLALSCDASPPSAPPARATIEAPDHDSDAWRLAHGIRYTREQIRAMRDARPAPPDPRTPDQLADAACSGPIGEWLCPARPRLLRGGGASPAIPASWTVPNWYVDNSNATGCASNNNSCTSATCGTTGIGPCLNETEITAHRWGTSSPVLAQTTTVNFLSNDTADNVVLTPVIANGVVFGVIGTPTTVATFTLGTITAKNRSTRTLLQSTGFAAGGLAVGQVVVNATHPSHALIDALGGGTATLSQPLAPLTIANAVNFPPTPPAAEVDTWTTGDSVTVENIPTVNIVKLVPYGGQAPGSLLGGTMWMQYIHVADSSGSPGNSYYSIGDGGSVTTPWVVDSKIDSYTVSLGASTGGTAGGMLINDFFAGGVSITNTSIVGGVVQLYGCGLYQFAATDGDVIVTSQANQPLNTYEQGFIGLTYTGNGMNCYNGSRIKLDAIWYPSAILWGPGGTINVADMSVLENVTGQTWVNSVLVTTLTLDGQGTATKYVAGTFTDGVSVTQANIDSFGGLQNPKTGAKFCNTL